MWCGADLNEAVRVIRVRLWPRATVSSLQWLRGLRCCACRPQNTRGLGRWAPLSTCLLHTLVQAETADARCANSQREQQQEAPTTDRRAGQPLRASLSLHVGLKRGRPSSSALSP